MVFGEKLVIATENENLQQIKEALASGTNIHAKNDMALRATSTTGHYEIVDLLHVIPVYTPVLFYYTPFFKKLLYNACRFPYILY